MKKIFAILFILAVCFSGQYVSAEDFNAAVDTKSANPGDTVDINIMLENNSGIIAALFSVEYDTARLELIEARDGKLLESGTFSPDCTSYPYKMVWNSAAYSNFTDDGILATLKFKVLENAESGKAYINLSYDENDVFDVDLNNVKITVLNGGIDVIGTPSASGGGSSSSGSTAKTEKKDDAKAEIKEEVKEDIKDSTAMPSENKITFADVNDSDWFFGNVDYVVKNGLMNGVSATEFAPEDNLTRAMLVTILYRAENEPEVNKSIPFADVTADMYYADAVAWAHRNGIVSGMSETEFAPDENITREQIAAIVYRYAKYKGYNVSASADLAAYTDADEISEYAIEAMKYAVGSGLIKGKTATTLNPKDTATRAEIAAILQRFIEGNK